MDKLLASIATRIKYIRNNTDNAYLNKALDIIELKLQEIKDRKYNTQEVIDNICDTIINFDIARMKGVSGQTDMVYRKMNELANFIDQIKVVYFDENIEVENTEE